MKPVAWVGTSKIKPQVTRHRTITGEYALGIVCWHGAQGVLVHPNRGTLEEWEAYASLNPCKWVESCPQHEWATGADARFAAWDGSFIDLVRPSYRTIKAERERRRRRTR